MRRNDAICQEMGLPVFDAPTQQARGMSGAEYHTALKGQSWKLRLMNTIDECMKYAADRDSFVSLMESEGYQVRWESTRKYITYTTPDGMRCRDNKLHEEKYCKEAMEHEFRIRAELVKRKLRRAEKTDGGIEADESTEQRTAVCATAADDAAHCDPVRSAAGDEQAGRAGRRNKLGAGGNSEDSAELRTRVDLTPVQKSLTEMQKSLTEMNKLLERVGNLSEKYSSKWIDWLPDFSLLVALKWIMLVLILARRHWWLVWRGGDPRPVPLIPAAAGLAAAGTLLDEDEDAEEKRRRMEEKIAAENFARRSASPQARLWR